MKSYLTLVTKYLAAHRKKTRLVVTSVAIAVALVTGIFSMLDFFQQFEKIQQIHEYGNYHLTLADPTDEERRMIASRIDVKNSGRWIPLKNGKLGEKTCKLAAIDENFAPNAQMKIIEGSFPSGENEIILEAWAVESLHLKVGDAISITFAANTEKEFIVSGVYSDYGDTKAADTPGVYMSISGVQALKNEEIRPMLFIEFKDRINISKAERDIMTSLGVDESRLKRNTYLLAVMGYGKGSTVTGLYITGAVLFFIILVAGVLMIYNTFNISVAERIRQFGLLRCVGASPRQVGKLVRREGLLIALRAVPIGLLAGMLLAILCSMVLKFYNSSLFGEITLFNVSFIGLAAGIVIGFLTVSIASSIPARKAARVPPICAVTGSSQQKISRKKKKGILTKMLHVDIAMGINNALMKKKTFVLMACSIAVSIMLFLGFQVFIDFTHASLKTTKPYTPDISLAAKQGGNLGKELYERLSTMKGIKKVYGRMFGYVEAAFDADRITDDYRKIIGDIKTTGDGLIVPPEKSWLISYDQNQLNWAKVDLIKGELSEEELDKNNGIVAVRTPTRKGITTQPTTLEPGDRVYIKTSDGIKEKTVMAVLLTVPFNDSQTTLTTFITTGKQFTELTGDSKLRIIDMQLDGSEQKATVNEIKSLLNDNITLYDQRQKNSELNGYFMTMAVFMYGFVAVIALISVLNIINTMNTSVASKTRYLGVMRAVGMSGGQLGRMVLTEAVTYGITGCVAGCILGLALQKALITNYITKLVDLWKFPYLQIGLILVLVLIISLISVNSPLKRIKAQGISKVIGSL